MKWFVSSNLTKKLGSIGIDASWTCIYTKVVEEGRMDTLNVFPSPWIPMLSMILAIVALIA